MWSKVRIATFLNGIVDDVPTFALMFTVHFFDHFPLSSMHDLHALAEKNGFTLKGLRMPPDSQNEWEAMKRHNGAQPQAWLLPLFSCPIGPQEDMVITALSARELAPYILSIPQGYHDLGKILQVVMDAEVKADRLASQYLKEVRPDLKLVTSKTQAKTKVLSWPYESQVEEVISFPLNHKEFPPQAGAGVWAWVAPSNDIALRRMLRWSHHPEVAQLTNIERELLARFHKAGILDAGIYAAYQDQGHIQLWMAWKGEGEEILQRCSLSSTSYLDMVEMAWEKTGLTFDTKITIRS